MTIDKYQLLKVAGNVLNETVSEMASSWGVSLQHVKGVARGENTSQRISENIDAKIEEGDKILQKHRESHKHQVTHTTT